ncbi:MAG: glycosyltransferase [Desulfobacteraceae bacterium]|nr:MAG: glycosyltransferase [Desulfobacteraceae bacterium]
MPVAHLYLGLIPGEYIGWGICSKYLIRELEKLIPVSVIGPNLAKGSVFGGKVFHTIGDHRLTKVIDVSGTENYGYTFFENLLSDDSMENAKAFDCIFAGSTWCREKLNEKGISWADVLIQGIDPELFHPIHGEKPGARDHFVIYSGGKFELRKAQDIVIRAVATLQERHRDVLFVNCWYNPWPFSMNTMAGSPLIDYKPQKRFSIDYLKSVMSENGVDLNRTEFLPRIPQHELRKIYACTDVGIFPNRCEGGTNLVLMEYMACGKPVVATFSSGHKDILTDRNSLCIRSLKPIEVSNGSGRIEAVWEEPDLDDIIDKLEFAYLHRDQIRRIGFQAGEDMRCRTWAHMAGDLVNKLDLKRIPPEP